MSKSKTSVLITGCSTGIGYALAQECFRQNFEVYATARKVETLSKLEQEGMHTLRLDVTDEKNIEQVVAQIFEEHGSIDMLINNAGYSSIGPLAEMALIELRLQYETNVFAAKNIMQKVLPYMLNQKYGKIVNIGSVSGILTTPFAGAYCSTKAALHSLTEALRMELAPFNIKVILVQPGAIKSNLGETSKLKAIQNVKPDSHYFAIQEAIFARADYSQQNPTATETFAKKLVHELMKENPKKVIRLGKGSFTLPFLKRWAQLSLLDDKLIKTFKLNLLAEKL
jgi:short-subunit dehydrogenase